MEKERLRHSYSPKEFRIGDALKVNIETIEPDTERRVPKDIIIESIEGGGFFGKVLFLRDEPFVIKTPDPDPLHRWLRALAWDKEFPHFSSRNEAVAEHIAGRIIHNVIPYASDGKFYAPASYGFTRLPNGHYAQIVEKIDQRPAKLGNGEEEDKKLREAQKELTGLGIKLGFEHVGQIHYDNPFGMSNIRIDVKTGSLIWLDTIPAIPHKGTISPIIPLPGLGKFPFHYRIREALNNGELTFNKIHTDILENYLNQNSALFPSEVLEKVKKDIKLYDKFWEEKSKEPAVSNRGEIFQASIDLTKELGVDAVKLIPNWVNFFFKIATDTKFVDQVLLSGIEQARKLKLVSQNEYDEAVGEFEGETKKRRAYERLYQFHIGSSQAINAIQLATIFVVAPFLNDPDLAKVAFGVGQGAPILVRPLLALYVRLRTGVDLNVATALSPIPTIGEFLAVPTQIAISEKKATLINHYKFREFAAKISKLHPAGGWGSQKEAEAYYALKQFIETFSRQGLANFFKDQEGKGSKFSYNPSGF